MTYYVTSGTLNPTHLLTHPHVHSKTCPLSNDGQRESTAAAVPWSRVQWECERQQAHGHQTWSRQHLPWPAVRRSRSVSDLHGSLLQTAQQTTATRIDYCCVCLLLYYKSTQSGNNITASEHPLYKHHTLYNTNTRVGLNSDISNSHQQYLWLIYS